MDINKENKIHYRSEFLKSNRHRRHQLNLKAGVSRLNMTRKDSVCVNNTNNSNNNYTKRSSYNSGMNKRHSSYINSIIQVPQHSCNTSSYQDLYNQMSATDYYGSIKNLIIEWEPPKVEVKKKLTYLGVVKMDPYAYIKEHGGTLIESQNLPESVKEIPTPPGIELVSTLPTYFIAFDNHCFQNSFSIY